MRTPPKASLHPSTTQQERSRYRRLNTTFPRSSTTAPASRNKGLPCPRRTKNPESLQRYFPKQAPRMKPQLGTTAPPCAPGTPEPERCILGSPAAPAQTRLPRFTIPPLPCAPNGPRSPFGSASRALGGRITVALLLSLQISERFSLFLFKARGTNEFAIRNVTKKPEGVCVAAAMAPGPNLSVHLQHSPALTTRLSLCVLRQQLQALRTVHCHGSPKARAHQGLCWADRTPCSAAKGTRARFRYQGTLPSKAPSQKGAICCYSDSTFLLQWPRSNLTLASTPTQATTGQTGSLRPPFCCRRNKKSTPTPRRWCCNELHLKAQMGSEGLSQHSALALLSAAVRHRQVT